MGMSRWVGKTAVVTGAGAGIGAAIALSLADAGMTVVGLDKNPHITDAHKVTGSGSIQLKFLDVSEPNTIGDVFEWVEKHFGGVHVMVNNAGVNHQGPITEFGENSVSSDNICNEIDTNLKGLILCTRYAVASMKKMGFAGHIVNISSVAGHYIPSSISMNVYAATKHAVTAFTASLTNELAQLSTSIKTTSICPGLVDSNMGKSMARKFPSLKPEDVADAVLFAVSTSSHVNITQLTIRPVNEILL